LFDMNTHVWFIFPDFLFKNVFGSIFTDNGLIWDSRDDLNRTTVGDIRNSVGMGLRFQAFVLQTFPVTLQFDWALRTADGEHAFYFGFGPKF
ncbi:MAG: BamA/TamA family outer membrane protein, partial [Elusimicrobia bacterium]|nr:BamA/TamA family outer membrane protein [Elusimicrobiota bacterium]